MGSTAGLVGRFAPRSTRPRGPRSPPCASSTSAATSSSRLSRTGPGSSPRSASSSPAITSSRSRIAVAIPAPLVQLNVTPDASELQDRARKPAHILRKLLWERDPVASPWVRLDDPQPPGELCPSFPLYHDTMVTPLHGKAKGQSA